MAVKKESFFWTSYSDLMTSLFFIMLVLFVLTVVLLNKKMVEIDKERIATKKEIDKIQEIEQATKDIDSTYFRYNETYKKHILTVDIYFPKGESSINEYIDYSTQNKLLKAGKSIQTLINETTIKYKENDIQYLLIVEGQASNDKSDKEFNYYLSYKRAYNLVNFWDEKGLKFGEKCEVLIAGSGTGGVMRDPVEEKNQRFLIHIIPKPGMIEASKVQIN